jgi:photosystem II stability/assembly factor-like uncharacterized protein
MTSSYFRRQCVRVVCVCGLFLSISLIAQETDAQETDINYAEHQPLASESLLLDLLHDGERYVAVGERGHVVLSVDGDLWEQAEVVPTRSTLTTITRANGRLWAAGHDSVILTSGDHGKTWTRKYFDPDRQQPIMDIVFLDQSNAMAIGAYGLALVTSDGGDSWQDQTIGEDDWHLNAILHLGDGRLMIAGEAGFSYRSMDRGQSWETLTMPYPGSLFGIVQSSEDCLLVFGLRGHAQETCDFGEQWTELETGTDTTLSGAVRTAGAVTIAGNSGVILQRGANGSFTAIQHSNGGDFSAIVAVAGQRYLVAGEDGLVWFPEEKSTGTEP